MSLREFFELKEKNPHINCNFRIDNEFPNTLNPKRIRYPNSLKLEHDSLLAAKCNLNLPYICENFALKKLKGDMEITQAFLSEVQAQFDFCHLYGITQDPSTLEYLFIMRFAPQGDLRRYLLLNFDNLSLPNKLDRPHNESLVLDIVFNGLRPQTCHFAPPVYNDLLKRCWDQDSSKRPSIYEVTDFIEELCECRIRDKEKIRDDTVGGNLFKSPEKIGKLSPLYCQLSNSHNSGRIYNLMKWKPNKPTHMEAVYTSRLLSYKEYLLSRSKE
ncbi:17504_t:CDS:2 [Rhizophagus irregularis]|nr:17504_t:CDS:2 [Rhizophagus irregularis]